MYFFGEENYFNFASDKRESERTSFKPQQHWRPNPSHLVFCSKYEFIQKMSSMWNIFKEN